MARGSLRRIMINNSDLLDKRHGARDPTCMLLKGLVATRENNPSMGSNTSEEGCLGRNQGWYDRDLAILVFLAAVYPSIKGR
jgi:hypothetical protein